MCHPWLYRVGLEEVIRGVVIGDPFLDVFKFLGRRVGIHGYIDFNTTGVFECKCTIYLGERRLYTAYTVTFKHVAIV